MPFLFLHIISIPKYGKTNNTDMISAPSPLLHGQLVKPVSIQKDRKLVFQTSNIPLKQTLDSLRIRSVLWCIRLTSNPPGCTLFQYSFNFYDCFALLSNYTAHHSVFWWKGATGTQADQFET